MSIKEKEQGISVVRICPALLPAQLGVPESDPYKWAKIQRTGGGSRTFCLRPRLPKGRVH